MEMKQFAESILNVSHTRKIKGNMLQYEFSSRPLLWDNRIKQQMDEEMKRKNRVRWRDKVYPVDNNIQFKSQFDNEWSVNLDQMYCLKFDGTINIQDTWVDG